MNDSPNNHRIRRRSASVLLAAAMVAACSSSTPASTSPSPAATGGGASPTTDGGSTGNATGLFDSFAVHSLALTIDLAAYDAMIETYEASGEKEWIEATVDVDGLTYERVGIRLKGNSSLAGAGMARAPGGGGPNDQDGSAGNGDAPPRPDLSRATPESLPWLVDLDRFVGGQNHDGVVEFVVRSGGSMTALSEAVALELLEDAGLASQDAIAVRFSVNGGDEVLRLVIENPDDTWMAESFASSGALYKAESTGDYSYRGDDPAAYDEVFDQEAGADNADLAPLIEFLDFLNNADDATFAAEIETRLDVDSFASYLAMQELLQNFDDIDGPGNNSYLYYEPQTGQFTVVPWDYNLAFGPQMGPGRGFVEVLPPNGTGDPHGGLEPPQVFETPELPDGATPPAGIDRAAGGGRVGGPAGSFRPMDRSNVLVERFLGIEEYETLVAERTEQLREALFDSGVASGILADWVAVLQAGASNVDDAETIASEAERIAEHVRGASS